ncbi:MAG: hypoxanthine phosphoribosyltransferase [Candidatus Cloacimonetes bacterium]|nr:hypoxanthine phosphoribosyltransferase [Candidatus Cloacimonadota bacterium]
MNNDISTVLFDEAALLLRVRELGAEISRDYEGKRPVLISILRGGVVFLADLMRAITVPLEIDFMSISSYGDSTKSTGVVRIRKDIDIDLAGRHVLVVEDIVDSGLSLAYIRNYLAGHNPASMRICAMFDKPAAHKTDVVIDYIGFNIGNEFVVGYGLDYAETYRNLPFLGVLKEEVYR